MKLRKPVFKDLLDNYKTEPTSVHDCPRIYTKDASGMPNVNTCAVRISEGIVIALGLVANRTKIGQLAKSGDGKAFLLGKYGYRDTLCPHGIGRGARDVAYFLQEQWGKPTHSFKDLNGTTPPELADKTGVISFIKIPGYGGQGHMDVWNKTDAVGHAYFNSEKVLFWQLA